MKANDNISITVFRRLKRLVLRDERSRLYVSTWLNVTTAAVKTVFGLLELML